MRKELSGGVTNEIICARAQGTAAYLDGELDAASSASFEEHLKVCRECSATLAEQRRLLCLLDVAFGARPVDKTVALPKDFARVVTARARTDMRGPLRRRTERVFAIKLCLVLAALSAALLGSSLFDSALAPAWGLARQFAAVASVAGHAFADAALASAVIGRAVGGRLVAGPQLQTILQWMLIAGAALLLLRLIGSYHRANFDDRA